MSDLVVVWVDWYNSCKKGMGKSKLLENKWKSKGSGCSVAWETFII